MHITLLKYLISLLAIAVFSSPASFIKVTLPIFKLDIWFLAFDSILIRRLIMNYIKCEFAFLKSAALSSICLQELLKPIMEIAFS